MPLSGDGFSRSTRAYGHVPAPHLARGRGFSGMTTRITEFREQADGSRSFGLNVNGVSVLLTAGEGKHEAARALAQQIASIGPEGIDDVALPETPPRPTPAPKPRSSFTVGQRVWCNVHGAEGYCTVTAVGEGRHRGYIKITGERAWCPAGNFSDEGP